MEWVCYNGRFIPADQPIFSASHTAVKYGDGVFETIKVYKGQVLLSALHFERLVISLQVLQINPELFDLEKIQSDIIALCQKNNYADCARVRVTVFRNASAEYLIEGFSLAKEENEINKMGWKLGLFPFARKSEDAYANIKTVNYQLYILADLYAKEKGWDEALVLNTSNHIADGSKTNIFLIKGGEVFTPALHQGCVNGVMRRFVIDGLKKEGYRVHQAEIKEGDLLQADEIFCTNAIRGIRWVSQYKDKQFDNKQSLLIHSSLLSTIYQ